MRPMRIVIADDERLARGALRILLEGIPDTCIVAECGDGRSAAAAVERDAPDALFLDIEMPGLSGFDVLEHISPARAPSVVFVTAYREHALQAFDVQAVDYILKPLRRERVVAAAERARVQMLQREVSAHIRHALGHAASAAAESCCTRIMARHGEKSYFVDVCDLDWIEARGNYVCLHVGESADPSVGACYTVRVNIGELAPRLDPTQFLRIHRSTVVNLDRVDHVRPYGGSDYEVVLTTGHVLRVARGCRDRLLSVYH